MARFAGQSPCYPAPGEWVVVAQGEHKGKLVEVIGREGNVFSTINGVRVMAPDGEILWYWPWNLAKAASGGP